MAKNDIIRQFYGKNEKTCRNLSFGRNLFVYLHRIVCQSCAIGKKDGTKHLIAQFPDELQPRKRKRRASIITLKWAQYAQTSKYVIMGCCRPVWEYGEVCAIFIPY